MCVFGVLRRRVVSERIRFCQIFFFVLFCFVKSTHVRYVPNAKYLAHIPHQIKFDSIYQML